MYHVVLPVFLFLLFDVVVFLFLFFDIITAFCILLSLVLLVLVLILQCYAPNVDAPSGSGGLSADEVSQVPRV